MSAEIKAADARQLLDNPRFNQAFDNVKDLLVEQLERLPMGQARSDYAQELVVSLQVLEALKQDIKNDISDYQMESAPI